MVTKKIIHNENQEVRSGETGGGGSGWVGGRRRTPGLDEESTGRWRRWGRAVDGGIAEVALYLLESAGPDVAYICWKSADQLCSRILHSVFAGFISF